MQEGDYLNGRMILECPKCKHRWLETFKLPMDIDAFIARAGGFEVCPQCGNKKGTMMLTGEKFREAMKVIGNIPSNPELAKVKQ